MLSVAVEDGICSDNRRSSLLGTCQVTGDVAMLRKRSLPRLDSFRLERSRSRQSCALPNQLP